jgi:hypothetical protein
MMLIRRRSSMRGPRARALAREVRYGITMHVAALRQLSKSAAQLSEPAPGISPEGEFMVARLVRCECRSCGAHSNAMSSGEQPTACPNCGTPGSCSSRAPRSSAPSRAPRAN